MYVKRLITAHLNELAGSPIGRCLILTGARHLRGLKDLLDGPLLGGFVLHQGRAIEVWDHGLYALPAAALIARAL